MANKKVKKLETLIERYRAIQKIGTSVEIPYDVYRVFGSDLKSIETVGEHVCLGEDYVSVDHAREALSWYTTQLGGKVTWD